MPVSPISNHVRGRPLDADSWFAFFPGAVKNASVSAETRPPVIHCLMTEEKGNAHDSDRRGFFARAGSIILGGLAAVVPLLAGLRVLLDPLRRSTRDAGSVFVTTLQALPEDGVPRKFDVVADRVDAWNTYRQVPIGAVYLRRAPGQGVSALNVVCPHAGCFVNVAADKASFMCPCHDSSFALDGAIKNPSSPSPRAMDGLEVEIRDGDQVWVRFRNFQPGHKEKIPVA